VDGITAEFSNAISGSNTQTKAGSGTLIWSGNNTGFTGAVAINAGTLRVANADALGGNATTSLNITGGALDLGGYSITKGVVNHFAGTTANGTLTGSSYEVYGGEISAALAGSGPLTKSTAGVLTLSGNSSSYNGTVTIAATGGALRVTHSDALGSTAGATIVTGGNTSDGSLEIIGGISLAENISIGSRNNPAAVLRSISGSNTLTGNITLGSGGLEYNIASDSGLLTINSNLTTQPTADRGLNISGDGDVVLGGSIADNGTGTIGLIKSGNGTLTLSGNNSFSGNTTVSGGTLALSGGSAIDDGGILLINSPGVVQLTSNETVSELFIGGSQQPAGSYTSSNPAFTGPGTLTVLNGAAAGGFTDWANTYVGGQAPGQDFDHDGIDNGAEYFMGTAGNAFTANPQPVAGVITWPVAGVSDATAIVEVSNDLSNWTNAAVTFPGSVDTSNPTQIQFTVPTGQGKLFTRLTVTVTP
jgi:autotransporter-associated beta strand protein